MTTESRPEHLRPEVISPAGETEKFVTKLQSVLATWQQNRAHTGDVISYNFSLSTNRRKESLVLERGRSGIDSVSLKIVEETPPSEIKHLEIKAGTLLSPQTALFNHDGTVTLYGDDPKDSNKVVIMKISPDGECTTGNHFSPAK